MVVLSHKFEIAFVLADDGAVFLLVLFRTGGKTPDPKLQVRSYMDVMREQNLSKEEVKSHCCIFIWKILLVNRSFQTNHKQQSLRTLKPAVTVGFLKW